jgi:phosphate transport system protein
MTQLEFEIKELKGEVINMWMLVQSQLSKARNAMILFDKDLAREVALKEKRVNAYEIKIDRDCENIFALYTPVAVDLRFLLAALKINNNLERIGDIAEGIARYVIDSPVAFNKAMLEKSQLLEMYENSISIMEDAMVAFENEDTTLARTIFKRDELLNAINLRSNKSIATLIKADPDFTEEAIYILSMIRKLERVGDQCTNIAEEIIFYVEAKVLKHQKM